MPDTDTVKTTPDDAAIVARLEGMNATWDDEAKTWTIPHVATGELLELLADTGRPIELKAKPEPEAA